MKRLNTYFARKLLTTTEITVAFTAIGLNLLFSYTAFHKAFAFAVFRDGLQNSPLVPAWSASAIAVFVLAAMLAASVCLLIGFWQSKYMEIGLIASTALIALFTLYVTAIVTVAPFRPCVCIGLDEKFGLGWDAHLLFNSILLIAVWAVTLLYYSIKNTDHDDHG